MKILAIETSCDDTAICLMNITETADGVSCSVLKNITHTQIEHAAYGGVFPALAKREHMKNLPIILEQVLRTDPSVMHAHATSTLATLGPNFDGNEIRPLQGEDSAPVDYICVTSGPGLEPALWCGIVFAKELGEKWNVPVIPVNHMEGHILSVLVPATNEKSFEIQNDSVQFPTLALLISGGHTELVLVKGVGDYQIIGKTVDDAVGEAFDKVARMLGLAYPGGPAISNLAEQWRESPPIIGGVARSAGVVFPRPMIHSKDYNFSFSGLKTAVLYHTQTLEQPMAEEQKVAIAHEFQNAVSDVLVHKTKKAIEEFGAQTLIIGGGVSANIYIKSELQKMLDKHFPNISFMTPTRELSTDNAIMIALAGYFKIQKNPDTQYPEIVADGNLGL